MLPEVTLRDVTRNDVGRIAVWLQDPEISGRWFGHYVFGEPSRLRPAVRTSRKPCSRPLPYAIGRDRGSQGRSGTSLMAFVEAETGYTRWGRTAL